MKCCLENSTWFSINSA